MYCVKNYSARSRSDTATSKRSPSRGRSYRFVAVARDGVDRLRIVVEYVKCGKAGCRCFAERHRRHGPYRYLRYEEWDGVYGRVRYRREYVPKTEIPRVRRWIRRYRNDRVSQRVSLGAMRRYVLGRRYVLDA
jgi:hypothetical protein